jgi:hypothetical protein
LARILSYATLQVDLYKIVRKQVSPEFTKVAKQITLDGVHHDVRGWTYDFDRELWRAWVYPTALGIFNKYEDQKAALEAIREKVSEEYGTWSEGDFAKDKSLVEADVYRALPAVA